MIRGDSTGDVAGTSRLLRYAVGPGARSGWVGRSIVSRLWSAGEQSSNNSAAPAPMQTYSLLDLLWILHSV